jgi:hypothetical protein
MWHVLPDQYLKSYLEIFRKHLNTNVYELPWLMHESGGVVDKRGSLLYMWYWYVVLFPSPKVLFFPLGFVPWGKVLVRQQCIYHLVFLNLMINVQIRESIRLKEESILQRNWCVVLFPSSYFYFFPLGFYFGVRF